jgi:hypothetical protein
VVSVRGNVLMIEIEKGREITETTGIGGEGAVLPPLRGGALPALREGQPKSVWMIVRGPLLLQMI